MTLVIKFLGGGGSGELSNPTGTLKKKKKKPPPQQDMTDWPLLSQSEVQITF